MNKYSDKELLEDLKRVSNRLCQNKISQREYNENGLYSAITYIKRFGGWNNALKKVNLETYKLNDERITNEELISDMQLVAKMLNKKTISRDDYKTHGNYNYRTLINRFELWDNALIKADLKHDDYEIELKKQSVLEDIKRVGEGLGNPRMKRNTYLYFGKYSIHEIYKYFGNFTNAMEMVGYKVYSRVDYEIPSKEDLINNVKKVSQAIDENPLYKHRYIKFGRYNVYVEKEVTDSDWKSISKATHLK